MTKSNTSHRIAFVVPCYNESANIDFIYSQLLKYAAEYTYEVIFVDDGSQDDTVAKIKKLTDIDESVNLIEFSRNFGKEAATSAGIHYAEADAIIMIDADGQHPVELIPKLIKKWETGKKVVIGVRSANKNEGHVKKYGSLLFYKLFNKFSGSKLVPGSTDFRLIDKQVQQEFKRLSEINRITRGLIDWVGFEKDYIYFEANPRINGDASYTASKLIKLALNSFVSLSFTPLFIMGYLGLVMSALSFLTGLALIIEDLILNDPLGLDITGSGYLGVLSVFLIGCVLISQGLMSLYISHIYQESQGRPLYIIGRTHRRSKNEK